MSVGLDFMNDPMVKLLAHQNLLKTQFTKPAHILKNITKGLCCTMSSNNTMQERYFGYNMPNPPTSCTVHYQGVRL